MTIELGAEAPDFEADSTQGRIRFHDYLGDCWGLLFSHPRDFSGVCMTELMEAARRSDALQQRRVRAAAISVVGLERRQAWVPELEQVCGQALDFPLIADPDGTVARSYHMIHSEHVAGIACRAFFIIDPAKKIRMFAMYPITVGRSFDEILRIIDSLQFTAAHGLVTPADWKPGDLGVIPPALDDEQARAKFPDGWEGPVPYLRLRGPGQ